MNELKFEEDWNLLIVEGGRRIHRDDIYSIKLGGSGNTYMVRLKDQTSLSAHYISDCHFYHIQ